MAKKINLTGYEKPSLENYTRDELRGIAKNYGMPLSKIIEQKLNKAQLIEEIRKNKNYQKAKPVKIGGLEAYIKDKAGDNKSHSPAWYRQHVYDYLSKKETIEPEPGKFYFFTYDAKWKNELPKWDVYPLIYLLKILKEDELLIGANVHYLEGKPRAAMAKSLLNNSNLIVPKQTLHSYLFSHLESFFFEVDKEDWEFIASLPLEKFIEK